MQSWKYMLIVLNNYKQLAANPDIVSKVVAVYNEQREEQDTDPDHALYSGGFRTDEERRWCDAVRMANPEMLDEFGDKTQNPLLRTLLFRYRTEYLIFIITD